VTRAEYQSRHGQTELANRYAVDAASLVLVALFQLCFFLQIYRTDYVLYHYVHYSTVTRGLVETYADARKQGKQWYRRFGDNAPVQRNTDEINEAVMVHTKILKKDMTSGFKTRCRFDYDKKWQGCWVAYPWPQPKTAATYNDEGMMYNCYLNEKVENFWVPKLREALETRASSVAKSKA
jgi:hypothetical protein